MQIAPLIYFSAETRHAPRHVSASSMLDRASSFSLILCAGAFPQVGHDLCYRKIRCTAGWCILVLVSLHI